MEYFCAAKPQSRDLNSVQWSEAERCLTALLEFIGRLAQPNGRYDYFCNFFLNALIGANFNVVGGAKRRSGVGIPCYAALPILK